MYVQHRKQIVYCFFENIFINPVGKERYLMMRIILRGITLLLLISTAFIAAPAYESLVGPTGVLKYDADKSYGGYTLFSPMINCKTTYLIDMEGNIVHQWDTEYGPGAYAMLLPNGNLLRAGTLENPL